MNRSTHSQNVAPPKAEHPTLPLEPVALAPNDMSDPAPTTPRAPEEILDWGEERFSVRHWGINE
jgi:hypothetical protein